MVEKLEGKIKNLDLEKMSPKELYYVALILKEVELIKFMSEHLGNVNTIILSTEEE